VEIENKVSLLDNEQLVQDLGEIRSYFSQMEWVCNGQMRSRFSPWCEKLQIVAFCYSWFKTQFSAGEMQITVAFCKQTGYFCGWGKTQPQPQCQTGCDEQ